MAKLFFKSQYNKDIINPECHDIEGIFGCSHDEKKRFWNRYIWKYCIGEAMTPNAAKIINELRQKGHKIFIVTSRVYTTEAGIRGKLFRGMLKYWLNKNHLKYDNIIFCSEENSGRDKYDACIKNNINVLIDDKAENLLPLLGKVNVICYSAAWNKKYSELDSCRADNFNEVWNIIIGLNTPELTHNDFVKTADIIIKSYENKIAVTYMQDNNANVVYSFGDIKNYILKAGKVLSNAGIIEGDRVAVISPHSPYAAITVIALAYLNITAVLIDAALPIEEINKLLEISDVKGIFTALSIYGQFSKNIKLNIVCIDVCSYNFFNLPENKLPDTIDKEKDVIAIIFSSGTTDNMKGIKITYKSVLLGKDVFVKLSGLEDYMSYLLVLPFNHIAGFTGIMTYFLTGCELGFIENVNSLKLQRGLLKFQPYYFAMVPKVFEIIKEKIHKSVGEKGKAVDIYFNTMLKLSGFLRKNFGINIGRKLFKSVISQVFGSNIFGIGTGAAPCKDEIAEFYLNLGLEWANLYATTETGVPITATGVQDKYPYDNVGNIYAHPEILIKISDKNENKGEILVKSELMMKGYFRRPDLTKQVFDNGYFKTGDYGCIDDKGYLHIIGRIKEAIVLKNGKKVSPVDVDDYYSLRINNCEFASRGVRTKDSDFDEIHIFVENKDYSVKQKEDIESRLNEISAEAPSMYKINKIHFIESIPKTSVGKVKRYCLLPIQQQSNIIINKDSCKNNEAIFFDIIKKHCVGIEPEMNSNIKDLGIDSLSMFELSCEISNTFGIEIADSLSRTERVEDLWNCINGFYKSIRLKYDINSFPMHKGIFAKSLLYIMMFISKNIWNIKADGLENIPKDTNYILCPNHESHLDGLWIFTAIGVKNISINSICCMAKEEHLENKFSKYWLKMLGGIPVDRMGNPLMAIQRSIECINNGKLFLIHPEGTRTRTGKMGIMKSGAAKIAKETGKSVIPVKIRGAYEIYPPHKRIPHIFDFRKMKKYSLQITFYKPINPSGRSVEEIMELISGALNTE